jgi:hypothetical protein
MVKTPKKRQENVCKKKEKTVIVNVFGTVRIQARTGDELWDITDE